MDGIRSPMELFTLSMGVLMSTMDELMRLPWGTLGHTFKNLPKQLFLYFGGKHEHQNKLASYIE